MLFSLSAYMLVMEVSELKEKPYSYAILSFVTSGFLLFVSIYTL
ncbi:DUF3953 domain-containing protein [Bacillus sp. SCS-153A]